MDCKRDGLHNVNIKSDAWPLCRRGTHGVPVYCVPRGGVASYENVCVDRRHSSSSFGNNNERTDDLKQNWRCHIYEYLSYESVVFDNDIIELMELSVASPSIYNNYRLCDGTYAVLHVRRRVVW